ncbi:uncharacterized protein DUF2796 [Luteibacter rhizovicinus]|uniref:Uncharacterized protein DUF2796 n=1 Tax=Luteibacter rhizovicinus TaxID=242606 RepID=A0A4R3YQK0_9GAMM|nr:DUF2796 domain-containing protein [Luteibacter rhizovicinus]TCV94681.1 uncharacterized protein DUF2796 [Luteibacter rhizovicinus]
MRNSIAAFLLVASIAAASVRAQDVRQLGPHVHGQTRVQVVVDGDTLDVSLVIPGADAVGFEHPPAGPVEAAAYKNAVAKLRVSRRWLQPSAAAACVPVSVEVSPHGYGQDAVVGMHAELEAIYRFRCSHVSALDAIDVRLVDVFPATHTIVADVLLHDGALRQELDPGMVRIDLKP